jgi:hypothetical protein
MSTIWVAAGRVLVARIQIRASVAQDDELADVVGAAAAGLGPDQRGELGGGREAG